jgi:PKD repeat protein
VVHGRAPHRTVQKGRRHLNRMVVARSSLSSAALLMLLLGSLLLPGCTEVLDRTTNPRASLEAYPALIQAGEMVTLDARASEPVEGVLTGWSWDFGDGTSSETLIGFTSHRYDAFGTYTITVEVTNDQGGTDEATTSVTVNGAPDLVLDLPTQVRAGDTALLDASASTDPEGGPLSFSWDLDVLTDADGNGVPDDDADAITPDVLLPTSESGLLRGRLTVSDADGGVVSEGFEVNVTTRRFTLAWDEQTVSESWEGYLDQGERWRTEHLPAVGMRVMAFEAVLELGSEVLLPYDNFTLMLELPASGWDASAQTTTGNVTRNEPASATLEKEDLNPLPESGVFEGDSADEVLARILNQPGARFGQGNWSWTVVADQADPDGLLPGAPDPDPGNDWTLEVRITVLVPRLVEVAYE